MASSVTSISRKPSAVMSITASGVSTSIFIRSTSVVPPAKNTALSRPAAAAVLSAGDVAR
jgi:hypothetical protein